MNKAQARIKAASIKSTLDELHDAVDALPDGPEKGVVDDKLGRLHAKLNGLAHKAADFFDDGVETFSGGTDRPADD